MNNDILNYFKEELAYLHEAGKEFGQAHPKIAGRLKLTDQGSKDPQIALLMEAFAFLNARIHAKLDSDFSEFTGTLLDILYPHYQAPIPSMSIAQLQPTQDLATHFMVPRGTMLESDPALGEICHFQTAYDTYLLPIHVETIEWMEHLQAAPISPLRKEAQTCLRIVLKCLDTDMQFAKLAPPKIRFFLKGACQKVFPLYEMLLKHTVTIALVNNYQDQSAVWLDARKIQAVGFATNEGLLPYPSRSQLGYRLLTEFFLFPEKYLFVDLLTEQISLKNIGNRLEIFLFFNHANKELQRNIDANVFALGCTPIINLFKHTAEPIAVQQKHYQYKVITDNRRPDDLEIYSIDEVVGVNENGEEKEYLPFYGMQYHVHHQSHPTFWSATRQVMYDTRRKEHSNMHLSLVDLDFNPQQSQDSTLYLKTTCMNRKLPAKLNYTENTNGLQLSTFVAPITHIRLLITPTPIRTPLSQGKHSALLAHLALNHMSLLEPQKGIENLREILKLYNFANSEEASIISKSLVGMQGERVTRRISLGAISAFCQGLLLTIEIEDTHFIGNSAYLFAKVLEQFLLLYSSINSFLQLRVVNKQDGREVFYGHPQIGGKNIL